MELFGAVWLKTKFKAHFHQKRGRHLHFQRRGSSAQEGTEEKNRRGVLVDIFFEERSLFSPAVIPRTSFDLEIALSLHTTHDPQVSKIWGKGIFQLAEIWLAHTEINILDSGCKDLKWFQMSKCPGLGRWSQ